MAAGNMILFFCVFSGIFNLGKKTWAIYTQNPKNALPVVTLPMMFK